MALKYEIPVIGEPYWWDDDILLHMPKNPYKYERSNERVLCANDPDSIEHLAYGRFIRNFVNHIEDNELGSAFAFETYYLFEKVLRVNPDPDLAFFDMTRQAELRDSDLIGRLIPDLIAERASISGPRIKRERRLAAYWRVGIRLVWIIDTDARTITTYHPDGAIRVLTENDVLDGGGIVPEFSRRVVDLMPYPGMPPDCGRKHSL